MEISTVNRLFDDAVTRFADRDAILFARRRFTFKWIATEVERLALALMAHPPHPERIALLLPNAPFHPIAFFATLKIGGTVVNLTTFDSEAQVAYKLSDSEATTLITTDDPDILAKAKAAVGRCGVIRIVVIEEAKWGRDVLHPPIQEDEIVIRYERFLREASIVTRFDEVTSEQLALIQYTGGTTGAPKGAMITHANISAALSSYFHWFDSAEAVGPEIVICALPVSHVYGLVTIFLKSFLTGALVSMHYRFKVADVLRDIVELRATTLPAVPTIWKEIVDYPGVETYDLSSLRLCSAGGAPLPISVKERVEALTGRFLRGGWGMTETIAAGTNRPSTGFRKDGSIGIPLPGLDLQIVSLVDRTPLPTGEVGEICVRGQNVIAGYLQGRDAESFEHGWFKTGDLGFLDADGFVSIVGRRKEMIIVNGLNVYPMVVEQAILGHPNVDEVIVVGIPDERRGEAVGAFVTLRFSCDGLGIDELREYLSDKLGRHELPTSLSIRQALPRTPVGKPSRRELLRELGFDDTAPKQLLGQLRERNVV
ncbi:AMP-binding protein [Bradyrhizobium sp. UFLA05-112]